MKITAERVDNLLRKKDYQEITRFARMHGVLRYDLERKLSLQPPSLVSMEDCDYRSLGRLYAYLIDVTERRLEVQSGLEEIQRFSVLRVDEELAIARRLFEWQGVFSSEFMDGIAASKSAHHNLSYTIAQFRCVIFGGRTFQIPSQ